MKKKTVLTGFGTALSDAGALTLILKDMEGRKSEVIVLPSMVPKIVEMLSAAQGDSPSHIAVQKVPHNSELSRAERETGAALLDADKRPDGWYSVVTRLDLNAAFLLLRQDGKTVQVGFQLDDLQKLILHLENAQIALGGSAPTVQ